MSKQQISVLGADAWGSALASLLARNGHECCLWGRDADMMKQMARNRINQRYLPGLDLPHSLSFSSDLNSVLQADAILVATPTPAFSGMLEAITAHCKKPVTIMWACKGLEVKTGALLSDVVERELGPGTGCALISGPSFAAELVKGLPTAVTVVSKNLEVANRVSAWLHSDYFRAYSSTDMVGVEIGGALKNVYAIAAGISDGLGFGANARAALITRGLAELIRLGVTMGGQQETMVGLSGMGDLVLTCTDNQSRNRRFGLALARGLSVDEAHHEIKQVVEGVKTARDARQLADKYSVEMPIVEQVYDVIYHNKSPQEAVKLLLSRSQKHEQ